MWVELRLSCCSLLLILILPKLNSAASASSHSSSGTTTESIGFGRGFFERRGETRSSGKEWDYANTNTDAESGGGIGAVERVVGDEIGIVIEVVVVVMMVVVVVVERGGRCDHKDVSEAHHAHFWWEAVVDGP